MGRPAQWEVVHKNNNGIVMIRDLERFGCLSVTNDAERVFGQINAFRRGSPLRVVYQGQDPNSEWWEIVGTFDFGDDWRVTFKPWHGEVWDRLTQTY